VEIKFLMISVAVTVLLLLTYQFFIRYTGSPRFSGE